jgi:DNA-binding transcriptional MerR regulator
MASPADHAQDATPRWTVAAVAARLGVAPATLRSWSHRYGIGPADHRAGRYRRYTDADVAELETMRRLAEGGMALTAAAAVARRRHRGSVETDLRVIEGERPDPVPVVDAGELRALVRAAQGLEADTLVHTLEASLEQRGVRATWNQLCQPGLAALDSPGLVTGCADGALVLAWAVTTSLRRFSGAVPVAPGMRRALLACTSAEHHTLALDALYAALAEQDVPVQILGPAVPTEALLHAVEQTRPTAVLIWAQRTSTARPTLLRRLLPHAVTVAAGPGWSTLRLPASVARVESLDDAVRLIRDGAERPDPTVVGG